MTIKAPAGSKAEVMQWLQGLRDKGFQRVFDVMKDGEKTGEVISAELDPNKSNVFLAEGELAERGSKEAMEALIKQ